MQGAGVVNQLSIFTFYIALPAIIGIWVSIVLWTRVVSTFFYDYLGFSNTDFVDALSIAIIATSVLLIYIIGTNSHRAIAGGFAGSQII